MFFIKNSFSLELVKLKSLHLVLGVLRSRSLKVGYAEIIRKMNGILKELMFFIKNNKEIRKQQEYRRSRTIKITRTENTTRKINKSNTIKNCE